MREQIGSDTISKMCWDKNFNAYCVKNGIYKGATIDDSLRRTIELWISNKPSVRLILVENDDII